MVTQAGIGQYTQKVVTRRPSPLSLLYFYKRNGKYPTKGGVGNINNKAG
jgi:hypothetical protein